jgi:acetyl esterase/lipase
MVGLCLGVAATAGCEPPPPPTYDNVSTLHVALDPTQPFTTVAKDAPSGRQAVDIRLPEDTSDPVPVLIFVPGGGWVGQNPDSVQWPALLDDGFAIVTVDYRPARTSTGDNFAQLASDVDRAVRWVRAHHERLGIDPDRVILGGHSAGAHLAASVAVGALPGPGDPCPDTDGTCSPPLPSVLAAESGRPDGLVLLAGAYDLTDPALISLPAWGDPDPGTPEVETVLENLLGCSPLAAECADEVAAASPSSDAHQPLLGALPPTYVAVAQDDDVVDPQQSLAMAYRLCIAGVPVSYEDMPTGGHLLSGLPPDTVAQFLSQWNPAVAPPTPAPTSSTCNT